MKNYQPKQCTIQNEHTLSIQLHCLIPPKIGSFEGFPQKFGGMILSLDCPPPKWAGKLYVPNGLLGRLPGQPIGPSVDLVTDRNGRRQGSTFSGLLEDSRRMVFFLFTGKKAKMFTYQSDECLIF